ncbi:MAG: hypothetical protein U9R32_07585 [Bacteroidota bacterium]|nr:hypothetical protein [Bacteroidota bacterium]
MSRVVLILFLFSLLSFTTVDVISDSKDYNNTELNIATTVQLQDTIKKSPLKQRHDTCNVVTKRKSYQSHQPIPEERPQAVSFIRIFTSFIVTFWHVVIN